MKPMALVLTAAAIVVSWLLSALLWFFPFVVTAPLFLSWALRRPGQILLPMALLAALLSSMPVSAAGAVLVPLGLRRALRSRTIDASFSYWLILVVSAAAAEALLLAPPAIRLWRGGATAGEVLYRAVPLFEGATVAAAAGTTVFAATVLLHFNRRADV